MTIRDSQSANIVGKQFGAPVEQNDGQQMYRRERTGISNSVSGQGPDAARAPTIDQTMHPPHLMIFTCLLRRASLNAVFLVLISHQERNRLAGTSLNMHKFALTLAVVLGAILCSAPAEAFGTIRGAGQNAEHEKITRAALKFVDSKTLDEIAGKDGAFGAIGAPDRPGRGLIATEVAHCDNGDFLEVDEGEPPYPQSREAARLKLEKCRDFIFKNFDQAVLLAGELAYPTAANTVIGEMDAEGRVLASSCPFDGRTGSVKCRVIEYLGIALHASQDFYSHTNWTDEANGEEESPRNAPALSRKSTADFIDPAIRGSFPQGLVSGCFDTLPETWHCNYRGGGWFGLNFRERVKHHYLNKDKGTISSGGVASLGTTPRGSEGRNFALAVEVAVLDTRKKWAIFEEKLIAFYGARVGRRIGCLMKSDSMAQCPDIWDVYRSTCAPWRDLARKKIDDQVRLWRQNNVKIGDFPRWPTLEDMEADDEFAQLFTSIGTGVTFSSIKTILESEDPRFVSYLRGLPGSRNYEYFYCNPSEVYDLLRVCAAAVRNLLETENQVPKKLIDGSMQATCN